MVTLKPCFWWLWTSYYLFATLGCHYSPAVPWHILLPIAPIIKDVVCWFCTIMALYHLQRMFVLYQKGYTLQFVTVSRTNLIVRIAEIYSLRLVKSGKKTIINQTWKIYSFIDVKRSYKVRCTISENDEMSYAIHNVCLFYNMNHQNPFS